MTAREVIAEQFMIAKGADDTAPLVRSLGDDCDADDLLAALDAAGYAVVPKKPTMTTSKQRTEKYKDFMRRIEKEKKLPLYQPLHNQLVLEICEFLLENVEYRDLEV